MIDEKFGIPPSPPTSPRMSDAAAKNSQYQPQEVSTSDVNVTSAQPNLEDLDSGGQLHPQPSLADDQLQRPRPPLRSHKSFPYSLGPTSRSQDGPPYDHPGTDVLGGLAGRVLSQGSQPTGSADFYQNTFGGSAPTSPATQLTPNSPNARHDDIIMEDEELDFDMGEEGEETERPSMTAAELRAHKRKMKRFR